MDIGGVYIEFMMIITENTTHAESFISPTGRWQLFNSGDDSKIAPLIDELFKSRSLYIAEADNSSIWKYLLISRNASQSQYDIANDLLEHNVHLPHGIMCLAGSGGSFHGFRQRPWLAPAGNIYLTASFTPNRAIENFGVGFLTLAAVSVVDAIAQVPGMSGRAKIKWVNDILIDHAKVCGVLAYTQQEGDKVTGASLGIGLNVLTTPTIEPTIFVPRAGSLIEYVDDESTLTLKTSFKFIYESLEHNYNLLLNSGYKSLLDKYRSDSLIIGRRVEIYDDVVGDNLQLLHKGVVQSIGDHLELHLQGIVKPITRGRLALAE